jgi:hypothetical protein
MSSLVANLLPSVSSQTLCYGFLSIPGDTVIAPLLGRQCLLSKQQRVPREGRVFSFVGEAGLRRILTPTILEARIR